MSEVNGIVQKLVELKTEKDQPYWLISLGERQNGEEILYSVFDSKLIQNIKQHEQITISFLNKGKYRNVTSITKEVSPQPANEPLKNGDLRRSKEAIEAMDAVKVAVNWLGIENQGQPVNENQVLDQAKKVLEIVERLKHEI